MNRTKRRTVFLAVYAAMLIGGIGLSEKIGLWAFVRQASQDDPKLGAASAKRQAVQQTIFEPRPGGRPRSGCLPSSSLSGAQVVAVGAYQGGRSTSLAFANYGDPVGSIALAANSSGPPLVLALNGYEPIIWDLSAISPKRLSAVVVYGYSPQGLIEVPAGVPVRFAVREQAALDCGEGDTVYEVGAGLERWQQLVEAHLGIGFSRFEGGYEPTAIHLDGGNLANIGQREISADRVVASAPLQRSGIYAGKRGLEQLIAAGVLRHSTPTDEAVFGRSGYVVLRATNLPSDLNGVTFKPFLLPKGVPVPGNLDTWTRIVHEPD